MASCAAAVMVLVLSVGCSAPSSESDGWRSNAESEASTALGEVQVVADGLEAPWSLAFHTDSEGAETPLVSERDSARILELAESGETREVATIHGVSPQGEGGLLGIAVDDGYLYTYFTSADDNRVERFEIMGASGSLKLRASELIIAGIPSAGNHNGGRIAFGPDGMLYVTTGDAGKPSSAQEPDSLGGKILRLTPDGGVPDDNPFPGSPVFTLGHRNPQGIAWSHDGTMVASEFGQNTWDELNVIEPGSNYGWPKAEGIADTEGFVDPVQQWEPGEASPSGISISGETIYIANLRGERLRKVPLDELDASREYFVGEYGRLRDVVAAHGALWVLTNNTDGRGSPGGDDDRILRIELEGVS